MRRYFDEYRGLRDSVGQKSEAVGRAARSASCARSVAADRAYLAARSRRRSAARAAGRPRARRTTPGAWCSAGLGRARRPASAGRCARLLSLDGRGDGVTRRVAPRRAPSALRATRCACSRDGTEPLASPSPVRRRARVARARLDRAAVRRGKRRAHDDLPDDARARAPRPPLLAVGARPGGHRAALERRRCAAASKRLLRAVRRARWSIGLRATGRAPTWRSPRAGRPSTRCCACPAAAPAPTSSRTTSPSSSPPPPQSRAGGAHLPLRACPASPPAPGCAEAPARPLRRRRPPRSSSAWTPPSTTRCRTSRGGATPSSSTRATHTPRRAVRARPARARSSCSSAGRACASCCSGPTDRSARRSPSSSSAWSRPDRLRRLYSEATVGLSLSLTNYSLIPQRDARLRAAVVELAGRACEASTATTAR